MNKINELSKWFKSAIDEKSDKDFVRPLMKEIFNINGGGDWKERSVISNGHNSVSDFKSPGLESNVFSTESYYSYSSNETASSTSTPASHAL